MQELAYEKKQQYLADYQSLSSWISNRRGVGEVIRKALSERMTYFKVEGIVANRQENYMTQLLSSIYALKIPITTVFQIENHKLTVWIGSSNDSIEVLHGLFTKVIGCKCLEHRLTEQELFSKKNYGFESAIAGDALYKEEHCQSVLDILLSGGLFDNCSVVVSAAPLSREMGARISDYFDGVVTEIGAITSRQITSRDDKDSVTYTEENGYLKRFEEIVEASKKKYEVGRREGLFISSVKIYAESPMINDLIAGTFFSQSANEDFPEIMQHIQLEKSFYNSDIYMSMKTISINGRSINLPEVGNCLV